MNHELIALIIGDSILVALSTALWFVGMALWMRFYILTHPVTSADLISVVVKHDAQLELVPQRYS